MMLEDRSFKLTPDAWPRAFTERLFLYILCLLNNQAHQSQNLCSLLNIDIFFADTMEQLLTRDKYILDVHKFNTRTEIQILIHVYSKE